MTVPPAASISWTSRCRPRFRASMAPLGPATTESLASGARVTSSRSHWLTVGAEKVEQERHQPSRTTTGLDRCNARSNAATISDDEGNPAPPVRARLLDVAQDRPGRHRCPDPSAPPPASRPRRRRRRRRTHPAATSAAVRRPRWRPGGRDRAAVEVAVAGSREILTTSPPAATRRRSPVAAWRARPPPAGRPRSPADRPIPEGPRCGCRPGPARRCPPRRQLVGPVHQPDRGGRAGQSRASRVALSPPPTTTTWRPAKPSERVSSW